MKSLLLGKACVAVVVVSVCGTVFASPTEPTPSDDFRSLRAGDEHVQTWYIYNDSMVDGILNPGDTRIDMFDNWWTPVSAHTQHNYEDGPYGGGYYYDSATQDMPSGPMNFATSTLPAGHPNKNDSSYNYWLPMATNEIHFFMTYSQYDNNDFSTFHEADQALTADEKTLARERNLERNGWAMGWVTNAIAKVDGQYAYDDSFGGSVNMDVFVHDGQGTFDVAFADGMGTSRSNPQVSMSNDISHLAGDGSQWHPPSYDEASGTYATGTVANEAYKDVLGLTDPEFDTIVTSMEITEVDPAALTAPDVIYGDRRPSEIEANLTDHAGAPYLYQDAFIEDSTYVVSTSDGGVIAGLSGWDEYDPGINNWGDQQVIRIDLSPETLSLGEGDGNITKIVFYDFGYDGAADQVSPREIVLWAENGELFALDDDGETRIYFPENRIYIARVEMVPEPATIMLLIGGGIAMVIRRTRRA